MKNVNDENLKVITWENTSLGRIGLLLLKSLMNELVEDISQLRENNVTNSSKIKEEQDAELILKKTFLEFLELLWRFNTETLIEDRIGYPKPGYCYIFSKCSSLFCNCNK